MPCYAMLPTTFPLMIDTYIHRYTYTSIHTKTRSVSLLFRLVTLPSLILRCATSNDTRLVIQTRILRGTPAASTGTITRAPAGHGIQILV